MRLFAKVVGVTAVAALALTGCGRGSDSGGSGGGGGSTGGSSGFPADAVIGVSLPQKTSENWVLAESLFNDGLKQAGFKGDVQFANGGVSEQQNQIQAMITVAATAEATKRLHENCEDEEVIKAIHKLAKSIQCHGD